MKKVCSFCGRNEREVKLLITGINGYICDSCVAQAYQILQEQFKERSKPSAGQKLKKIINTDTILITKSEIEFCFV